MLYGPRQNGAFSEGAVRMLTDAHLVRAESRRGATWYELAHDRLIEPVKEDNARWREVNLSHFERLATWWDEQNRPDQALLTGPDLVNAETWVAANAATLSAREQEFFEASRKAAEQAERERRAAKRTRRWLVIAVVGCVLAATLGGWAWRAQRAGHDIGQRSAVTALAGQARDSLESDVDLGLLLARAAVDLPEGSPTNPDIQKALQLAVDQSPVVRVLRGHGPATSAVYSPDGRLIATLPRRRLHRGMGRVVRRRAVHAARTARRPRPDQPEKPGIQPGRLPNRLLSRRTAGLPSGRPRRMPANRPGSHRTKARALAGGLQSGRTTNRLAWIPRLVDRWPGSGRIVRGFDAAESADLSGVELEWTPDGKQLVVGDTKGVVSVWDAGHG